MKKKMLNAVLIGTALAIFFLHSFLMTDGVFLYRDWIPPIDSVQQANDFGHLWKTYQTADWDMQKRFFEQWLQVFIPPGTYQKIALFTNIVLAFSTMSFAIFSFHKEKKPIIAYGLAFAYVCNPVFVNLSVLRYFGLAYALLPLFILLLNRITFKKSTNIYPFSLIIIILVSCMAQNVLFLGLIIGVWFLSQIMLEPRSTKQMLKRILLVSVILIPLFSYYIVPMAMGIFLGSADSIKPGYVMTAETGDLFSSTASAWIAVILDPSIIWNPYVGYDLEKIGGAITPLLLIFLPLLAFSSLILSRRKHTLIPLAIAAILLIFLAKGTQPPFGEIYAWLRLKIPIIGWMLRVPWKALIALPAIYCIMASFSMERLKKPLPFIIILVICQIFVAWPLLTGDLDGLLIQEQPPKIDGLLQGSPFQKTVWYPDPKGAELTWNPRNSGDIYTKSSHSPVFSPDHPAIRKSVELLKDKIWSADDFFRFLSAIGVGRFIVHKDVIGFDYWILDALDGKESQKEGQFYVFNIPGTSPISIVTEHMTTDDLADIAPVLANDPGAGVFIDESREKIFSWSPYHPDMIQLFPYEHSYHYDPAHSWSRAKTSDPLHGVLTPSYERFGILNFQSDLGNGLVFTWGSGDPILKNQNKSILYFQCEDQCIKKESFPVDPNGDWAVFSSPEIIIEPKKAYQVELDPKGVENKGFHAKVSIYDSNDKQIIEQFLFTGKQTNKTYWFVAPVNAHTVKINLLAKRDPLKNITLGMDNAQLLDITENIRKNRLEMPIKVQTPGRYDLWIKVLESTAGGYIDLNFDGIQYELNTLKSNDVYVWKHIDDFYVVQGSHTIRLENGFGFNAIQEIRLVPHGEIIDGTDGAVLQANEFRIKQAERKNGSLMITPLGAAYSSLNLKAGTYHIKSRGDKVFHMTIGDIIIEDTFVSSGEIQNITLEMDQKKSGKIDLLEYGNWSIFNQNNHSLERSSDNLSICSVTTDVGWEWKQLRSPLLKVDDSFQISFNTYGMNVYGAHYKIAEFDKDGNFLNHTFQGRIGSDKFNKTIVLHGKKQFEDTESIQLQLWHGHLSPYENENRLCISNVSAYLFNRSFFQDIYIIPSKNKTTRETIINEITRESNSVWTASAESSSESFIRFTEQYHPLWQATIIQDGKVVEKIKPVELFGIINGFKIETIGNFDVKIEFLGQKYFIVGLAISILTGIASVLVHRNEI